MGLSFGKTAWQHLTSGCVLKTDNRDSFSKERDASCFATLLMKLVTLFLSLYLSEENSSG